MRRAGADDDRGGRHPTTCSGNGATMTDSNQADRVAEGDRPASPPAAAATDAIDPDAFNPDTWEGCRGTCAQCAARKQCEDGYIPEKR